MTRVLIWTRIVMAMGALCFGAGHALSMLMIGSPGAAFVCLVGGAVVAVLVAPDPTSLTD